MPLPKQMPFGVTPKTHYIDPMDPKRLTLYDMRQYPFNLWAKYIEPNIVAMGTAEDDCWCWDVKNKVIDIDKWIPQVRASWNPERQNPTYARMNVRAFVMRMFYDFPANYSIYRNKRICSKFNCVRPSHLIAAPHNTKGPKYGS